MTRKWLLLVAVLSFIVPRSGWAEFITEGDAFFNALPSGASTAFSPGPADDQLFEMLHWISINGGAPISTGAFDVVESVAVVDNTWTSAIELPGELRINWSGTLLNPISGNNIATVLLRPTFVNLTDDPMELIHYYYNDIIIFELGDDNAIFDGTAGLIRQWDFDALPGIVFEFGSDRQPDFWEIDFFDELSFKLDTAATAINLLNQTSPLTGDVTGALQFNFSIAAGESASHELFLRAIPEPSSILLFGLGAAAIGVGTVVRRRKSVDSSC